MKSTPDWIEWLVVVFMALAFAGLLNAAMSCGPIDEYKAKKYDSIPDPDPKHYIIKMCVWCVFEGPREYRQKYCYDSTGRKFLALDLEMDPSIWVWRACCDSWWGGMYMAFNSGACDAYQSWAAKVPPVTPGGCDSEETWNAYCDEWNEKCASMKDPTNCAMTNSAY